MAGMLGHRAVLRLLEDAMLDACEREGEDEPLDGLEISPPRHGDGDGDDEGDGRDCDAARQKRSRR